MAAPRENLLSLGHLSTDRGTFTNPREHNLKKSFNRSMTLQADFSTHKSPHLRVLHLQQRWHELKERERAAQQHNRELLQQFEKAQGTLREMMVRTAAMKTIRMEYERYLEESSPRWQQQLKEKTQAAQRKRMDEYLKTYLKNTEEEQVTKSSVDPPLLSKGATKKSQNVSAPQEYYSQNSRLNYNQDDTLQSTWLTRPQPQTARFPVRVPYQPQGSSQAPPSFLRHPHPFQLQHLAATPSHHPSWPRQNPPPGWASPQPDHSWFWASGAAGMPSSYEALWGQLYMGEPPPERGVAPVVAEEAETGRAPSLKSERSGGSGSSHSSQELDIKPVRLFSGHTESSESCRDSSQTSREKKRKREKRGRARRTSSESERRTSQESSRTSSAIVIASVPVAQTSESEASSKKSSTSRKKTKRKDEEVAAESPRMERVAKKRTGSKGDNQESHNEESQCTGEESEEPGSENVGNQSPDEKSESCRNMSGSQEEEASVSVSIGLENGDADKSEQESSSSEQSSAGQKVVEVKGYEKELGDGEEDDDEGGESQRDEEQVDRDVEDDDEGSARKNTIEEEEEETGAEDEMEAEESDEDQRDDEEQPDGLKNKDGEIRKQVSPRDEELDEDESDGSEGEIEENDEGSDGSREEDEEQRSDQAGELEEERDSEDSIISPQEKRPKKIHVIPEESAEDDDRNDRSKTGSSEDNSIEFSDEDDIEDLLAPQKQTKKTEEKDLKTDEKPEVCDKVEIFQVTSTKTDQQSDSDEFDHFYD